MSAPTRFPKLRLDAQAVKTHELTATTLSRVQDNIAATVDPIASGVGATPIMGAAPPPWIAPSLINGFANFGSPYATAGFHKDALGYVHCKGVLKHVAGCAAGTVIMVFPVGYRVLEIQRFSVPGAAVTAQEISLSPDGNASPNAAIAAGAACDFSFIFLAEQ